MNEGKGIMGVETNLKVVRLKGGLGVVPPAGIQGAEPLWWGSGKAP